MEVIIDRLKLPVDKLLYVPELLPVKVILALERSYYYGAIVMNLTYTVEWIDYLIYLTGAKSI